MARETGQPGQGRAIPFREADLKICELCGWLNLDANPECFVCGWHGKFEHGHDIVHAAMELAVRRYGRLELQHLTDPRTYRQPAPRTARTRFHAWWTSLLSWLRR